MLRVGCVVSRDRGGRVRYAAGVSHVRIGGVMKYRIRRRGAGFAGFGRGLRGFVGASSPGSIFFPGVIPSSRTTLRSATGFDGVASRSRGGHRSRPGPLRTWRVADILRCDARPSPRERTRPTECRDWHSTKRIRSSSPRGPDRDNGSRPALRRRDIRGVSHRVCARGT